MNRAYAVALLSALEDCGVDTVNVRLVMRSSDDSVESGLARSKERYGYGDVKNFTDVSLPFRVSLVEQGTGVEPFSGSNPPTANFFRLLCSVNLK